MEEDCKGKHHKCGEFKEDMDKESKLKHLKECKENLQKKIKNIDEEILKLEN